MKLVGLYVGETFKVSPESLSFGRLNPVDTPLFLIALIIPGALIGGWQQVFFSTVWTLTYRETLAMEQTKENGEPAAPETA